MRFKDHFSARAAGYAAHRPRYPEALVTFLADHAPGRVVAWDAGCGSGQLSVVLASAFERVEATDASAEQIAAATPHPRVTYRQAPSEHSQLPPAVVDLAVAAQAAHWFDLPAYYAEVRRVARPGALVALIAYGRLITDHPVRQVVDRFYDGPLAPHWAPERRQVEDGYRGLEFPFAELVPPPLTIHTRWTAAELLGYVETWSAVRALEQREGPAALDPFRRDLLHAWGPPDTRRDVRWPLAVRAGHLPGGAASTQR